MKIKSLFLAVTMAVAAMLFQSCSSSTPADAGAILSTVPSDVSMVTVINSKQLLEKAGCKVEGSDITPGKKLTEFLATVEDVKLRQFFTVLTSGESGIDPSVVVVFKEGYNTYITGVASDPDLFKKTMSGQIETQFSAVDGIDVAGNCAIVDNKFWIALGSGSIDTSDVRHFNSLSSSQSFMQNPYGPKLASIVKDAEGWGSINGLLNTSEMKFQTRATYQVAIQTLFEDPSAFTFSFEWDNEMLKSDLFVLNSKGNNAKYLLPSAKVDVNTIASIGGTADNVIALAIPGKLVESLRKETYSKAPSVFGVYLQQLGCLDGTSAFALAGDNVKGVISTNGSSAAGLTEMLKTFGLAATINGSMVTVTKGDVAGPVNVADIANDFNGAIGGMTGKAVVGEDLPFRFSSQQLMLYKEGNSLRISFTLK